jgi:hypothetical protein
MIAGSSLRRISAVVSRLRKPLVEIGGRTHPGRTHATADRRSVRADHIVAVDSAAYITAH